MSPLASIIQEIEALWKGKPLSGFSDIANQKSEITVYLSSGLNVAGWKF